MAPRENIFARPGWRAGGVGLGLALVTLLVYLPVRGHGFIALDDADYVAANAQVQAGLTWSGVAWAFTTGHASNWHPLTWLSHMLDAELFGPGPAGPHVVNVLLHAANAVLLFLLLRRVTGAPGRSAIVAALFALHPLHVESVAWIAERKDVLSGFFFLLTLWAYTAYVQAAPGSAARRAWYGGALALFALGLMSKPMLVTLPCVLLLLDYWPLRRLVAGLPLAGRPSRLSGSLRDGMATDSTGSPQASASPTRYTDLLREKIPFFALSAASAVTTWLVQQHGGAVRSLASFSLGARLENAVMSYARYLGKTFWPEDLAVFYPHPGNWAPLAFTLALVVVMGLSFAAFWFARRLPFAAVGWLWFLGMLVPTIGLVQAGNQSMADRYTYLPLIGMFVALVWGADEILARVRWSRPALGGAAAVAVIAGAWRTAEELRHWRSSEALFGQALTVTRGNFVAHHCLGHAWIAEGRIDAAIAEFRAALAIQPDFADAHNSLGSALLKKGKTREALAAFTTAVELQPGSALARYNLGTVLLAEGRTEPAITQLQQAATLRPDDALTQLNLGNALLQAGHAGEAGSCYERVLVLQPDNADAHNNLGHVLLRKNQVEEASGHFWRALALQPDHANAYFNLGDACARVGKLDEAAAHFRKAVALAPDDADARHALAVVLDHQGKRP